MQWVLTKSALWVYSLQALLMSTTVSVEKWEKYLSGYPPVLSRDVNNLLKISSIWNTSIITEAYNSVFVNNHLIFLYPNFHINTTFKLVWILGTCVFFAFLIPRHYRVARYYGIPSDVWPSVCPSALLFWITPPTVFIRSRWNWWTLSTRGYSTSNLIELLHFLKIFLTWLCYRITPPTVFIRTDGNMMDN